MKKWIALAMALVLALSLAACGSTDDVRGEISNNNTPTVNQTPTEGNTETPEATEGTTENQFDVGSVSTNKYTNTFVGISLELGADWVFKTDEEIRALNEQVLGSLGDDYKEAVANVTTFTDMMAQNITSSSTVSVSFVKLSALEQLMSEEEFADASKSANQTALEQVGMTNVTVVNGKATIAGKEHAVATITGSYSGLAVYEKAAYLKCGNYMVLITVCTYGSDGCDELLNMFKAVTV